MQSVGTLVGGTAFAQGVGVLALPFLTRLYTPEQFSVLAVYAAALGILVAVACLRLEIAIPLPEKDEEAANLLALSLLSGLVMSSLLGALALFAGAGIGSGTLLRDIRPYIWLVPLGVAVASAYAALQYWSTRKKKFPRIARTRMTQALSGIGVQLGAGAAGLGTMGLLFGHMVSSGAGCLGLARDAWKSDRHLIHCVSLKSMRSALRRYSRFPKYSTWEALTNSAGAQLPIILIAAWAVGPEAGYLMLATRLMAAPMALIGGSIAQVYLAHAPAEMRSGKLGAFSASIFSGLVKTGVGPLIFVAIIADSLTSIAFGVEWIRTGELIAWMTPWFVLKFISSPVSMVMHVTNNQRGMLLLQLGGLIFRISTIALAFHFYPAKLAEAYALSGAAFYLFCCIVYYRLAGVRMYAVREVTVQALPILFLWVVAGGVVRVAINLL